MTPRQSTQRARRLRNHLTETERHLWQRLRRRQLCGYKFRRQFPIGPYIVDFVCLEARLVVELDGGQHNQQITQDQVRDQWLGRQGFRILRFWNNVIFTHTDEVLGQIMDALPLPDYAELHCLSNFSFLRGASHPRELVARAAALGYRALAITDACSLTGVVQAHVAAKAQALALIIGSEFRLDCGLRLVLLATDRAGYGGLCALISAARRSAHKGTYHLARQGLEAHHPGACLALWLPGPEADRAPPDPAPLDWLAGLFPGRTWIAVELLLNGRDRQRLGHLQALGARCAVPLVACGDVHMHARGRRPLQDTLTAIRLGRPLAELGQALHPNGERHLRPRDHLARIYPPGLLAETLRIAALCRFSLDELRYAYPHELVPEGHTPRSWLRRLVEAGMVRRWPAGVPRKVRQGLEHELALVAELAYEPYFLTVHDIVHYAREHGILCQGRGSAANSAVCYCLGITEVDPARMELLLERFISRERNEPPDIDVDFEHERREEVIQYIYRRYGRERAALAATVIRYRPRSAIRDVGKALGMDPAQLGRLAGSVQGWDRGGLTPGRIREAGLDPDSPVLRRLLALVDALAGFPRHLSQHVGGFVISQDPLCRLVPIENAAMPGRTVIQWEKDDLEALGLLKIDVLALGMLSAIRKALGHIGEYTGAPLELADIPPEDPQVYDMICRADTVGVFQIESRAQMSMLPRLRPRCYYDLVVQVAIVRPGPIQGEMVHPYLARRSGREPVTYPSEAVRAVLQRTLGVPIFQEQVMQLAMVAAGFSPGEADQLRRSMAAWHRRGGLERFERRLLEGMRERGYPEAFARQIFNQIKGFGEYGFPESHAASFALLTYVSAWLKHHHPAAFCCALLNSQPMGFYAPAQLVQDARRHGVEIRPVDVQHSDYDCALEGGRSGSDHPLPDPPPSRGREQREASPSRGRVREGVPSRGRIREGEVPSRERVRDGSTQRDHPSMPPPPCGRGPGGGGNGNTQHPALRLGLRLVKGLSRAGARDLVAARRQGPFRDVQDLVGRTGIRRADLEALAGADALRALAGHRHRAWWQAAGTEPPLPLHGVVRIPEAEPLLSVPTEGEDIASDYASCGLSLRRHPLALAARAPPGARPAQRPGALGAAQRGPRPHRRAGAHPPASGLRLRGHLRHPGGRDRHGQHRGLAAPGRGPAPRPARCPAAGGERHHPTRKRCAAPGGGQAGGPEPLAGRLGCPLAGFPLTSQRSLRARPEPRPARGRSAAPGRPPPPGARGQ
jgi:error-prone DNA polymerase